MMKNLPTQVKSIDVATLVQSWMQRPDTMRSIYSCRNAQFYDALCDASTIFCFFKQRVEATDKKTIAFEFEFYGDNGYSDIEQILKAKYTKLVNLRDQSEQYDTETFKRFSDIVGMFEKYFANEFRILKKPVNTSPPNKQKIPCPV